MRKSKKKKITTKNSLLLRSEFLIFSYSILIKTVKLLCKSYVRYKYVDTSKSINILELIYWSFNIQNCIEKSIPILDMILVKVPIPIFGTTVEINILNYLLKDVKRLKYFWQFKCHNHKKYK